MVRSASPLISMAALALVTPLLLSAGCVSLGKQAASAFSTTPKPGHVEVVWSKQVHSVPDPVHVGSANPAVVGRMYLFTSDQLGAPLQGSGKVIIDLFDDTPWPDGSGPKQREQMNFPADLLPRLMVRDQIGFGYTLAIPCPADVEQAHLTVRFEPADGGPPLLHSSMTFDLDRRTGNVGAPPTK